MVKHLLSVKGQAVNGRNTSGSTALMYAALTGRMENVRLLLAAGADPGLKDGKGITAQLMAKWQGFADIVKLLEQ